MSEKIAEQYKVKTEPFYRPVSNEVELYQAAYARRMPVMLKVRQAAASRVLSNIWPGS